MTISGGSGDLPSSDNLDNLNGIVYIDGSTNNTNLNLRCDNPRPTANGLKIADCYSGTCGEDTVLDVSDGSASVSTFIHDKNYKFRVTLTKVGNAWPVCKLTG